MKKLLYILLAAVLLTAMFSGCGSDESAMKKLERGLNDSTWRAISATDPSGAVIYEDELVNRMGSMQYAFHANGTLESTTLGEVLPGTWEVTAPYTVSITIGAAKLTAVKVKDTLELAYLGSTFVLVEEE